VISGPACRIDVGRGMFIPIMRMRSKKEKEERWFD